MWEYRVEVIVFDDIELAASVLNRMGEEGWELVTIVKKAAGKKNSWTVAIYKRHQGSKDSN